MSRVIINLDALQSNLDRINRLMASHGAAWTAVTKVLCGNAEVLGALSDMGVRSVGESRLSNLRAVHRVFREPETWYLRIPGMSMCRNLVSLAQVSLNSELETIRRLDEAAGMLEVRHRIIIMIELGDLREGILPGGLIEFYDTVFRLPNIEVLGIGTNLGCLAGVPPTPDQLMQLVLYRELLELKFKRPLSLISAGTSVILPLLLKGQVPRAVNHFRIGEALFLGTDLIDGGVLPGFRDDVILLEGEIVELKEKGLVPQGDSGVTSPFSGVGDTTAQPGRRGYRALIDMGQLDTDIAGLSPIRPDYHVAGASSDITVLNIGENTERLSVGDRVRFRMGYASLLRLMSSRYVPKEVTGGRQRTVVDDSPGNGQQAPACVQPAGRRTKKGRDAC
ncbi:MAG: alanine racemase [Candidatus Hydrogenedentes bacterium]|nr:alanine racemase [Candidatus Hydrogenedentota bacterium]